MSLLGLYVPGASILHRAPAGAKLLGLVGLAVVSQLLGLWWQRCLLLIGVLLLYPLARIGVGFALRQLRSLWWVLATIAVAQLALAGWQLAVSVVATIVLLVLAAGLVTLTTTTTALSDVVVSVLGPFRRFGVAPERVGLLLALSIRAVPVVLGLAEQIRDAQRARGLPIRPRAFAVPLLVRALRHAQQLGDALIARGLDD
ncbi:MAG TPA: energy-coupling factor transporter transmembrane protein EcfT [Microlunatus sp.]|nr:energy-coupling factor transporter transmembrane protein EcfT [Microlunatus sp.]